MVTYPHFIAMVILIAIIIYLLTGGADFGGGIWDLFARGSRKKQQRDLIAHTIAPIWEANHVWLIVVIVLLFVAFPKIFGSIMTTLHIPLTMMLIGIVLRGSSFTFRSYGIQTERSSHLWGQIFAITSIFTPFMLGICFGTMVSAGIPLTITGTDMMENFVQPWLAPFPLAIGLLNLVLSAFLAAVYLINQTDDLDLQNDFRNRALLSAVALFFTAFFVLFLAKQEAPDLFAGLSNMTWWVLLGQIGTGVVAIATIYFLWKRQYILAQIGAMAQTTLILLGWAIWQFPYILPNNVTFSEMAAPTSVLKPVTITLICGLILIIPSFASLYKTMSMKQRSD